MGYRRKMNVSFEDLFLREPGDVELCNYSPLQDQTGRDVSLPGHLRSLWEAEDLHIKLWSIEEGEFLTDVAQVGSFVRRVDPINASARHLSVRNHYSQLLEEAYENCLISTETYLGGYEISLRVSLETSSLQLLRRLLYETVQEKLNEGEDVLGTLEIQAFAEKWDLNAILDHLEIEKDNGRILNGTNAPPLDRYELVISQPAIPTQLIISLKKSIRRAIESNSSPDFISDLKSRLRTVLYNAKGYQKKYTDHIPYRQLVKNLPEKARKLAQEIISAAADGQALKLSHVYQQISAIAKVVSMEEIFTKALGEKDIWKALQGYEIPCETYPQVPMAKRVVDFWKIRGWAGRISGNEDKGYTTIFKYKLDTQQKVISWMWGRYNQANQRTLGLQRYLWDLNNQTLFMSNLRWEKVCPSCWALWKRGEVECQKCGAKVFPRSVLKRGAKGKYTICPPWNLTPEETAQYHQIKDSVLEAVENQERAV